MAWVDINGFLVDETLCKQCEQDKHIDRNGNCFDCNRYDI